MRAKKVIVDKTLVDTNILRRYLDLPRFVSFLLTQSLYLCRSDRFPDRFEGSFTPATKSLIERAYKKKNIKGFQKKKLTLAYYYMEI